MNERCGIFIRGIMGGNDPLHAWMLHALPQHNLFSHTKSKMQIMSDVSFTDTVSSNGKAGMHVQRKCRQETTDPLLGRNLAGLGGGRSFCARRPAGPNVLEQTRQEDAKDEGKSLVDRSSVFGQQPDQNTTGSIGQDWNPCLPSPALCPMVGIVVAVVIVIVTSIILVLLLLLPITLHP